MYYSRFDRASGFQKIDSLHELFYVKHRLPDSHWFLGLNFFLQHISFNYRKLYSSRNHSLYTQIWTPRYNFLFTLIISLNFPILCELTFPSCSTAVWFKQMMKFYHSISNGSMHKDINNYLFLFCEIVPILPWQIFFTYKFLVYKKRTITSVIFISQRYGKMFLIVKDVLSTSFCLFVFHHVFHLYGNNSF